MKFEEIELNEDLELVEKLVGRSVGYPAVTVSNKSNQMYFNKHAWALLPKHVKWLTTTDYVIALPADEKDRNAFSVRREPECLGAQTFFPVALRKEKKIKDGTYKLYKYKDGVAFKRYEPIGQA